MICTCRDTAVPTGVINAEFSKKKSRTYDSSPRTDKATLRSKRLGGGAEAENLLQQQSIRTQDTKKIKKILRRVFTPIENYHVWQFVERLVKRFQSSMYVWRGGGREERTHSKCAPLSCFPHAVFRVRAYPSVNTLLYCIFTAKTGVKGSTLPTKHRLFNTPPTLFTARYIPP